MTGRSAAGVIDRVGVAGPEQQIVGPSAAVGVAAEERPDVPLESDREGRDRRPAAEPAEGQAEEEVLDAAPRVGSSAGAASRSHRDSSYGAVESRLNR